MSSKARRRISAFLAPIMFGVSIAFLACLATLVVAWVDIPNLSEKALETVEDEIEIVAGELASEADLGPPAAAAGEASAENQDLPEANVQTQTLTAGVEVNSAGDQWLHASWMTVAVLVVMGLLWPIFWVETFFHWFTRPWTRQYRSYHLNGIAFCLCPPLRLCARNPDLEGAMWFPRLGWRIRNDELRTELQKFFSMPMLGIAVLILPVLGIEFFLSKQVAEHPMLRFGLHFSTGLIWFAFTCEFIVMISAAENRLDYCKKHWLDLAIILLPLISFLRSLQIVRATRIAKLTKVQQLSKMARVYRLRGVSTRALRALLLLEIANKLLRPKPAKQLTKLRAEHKRLSRELEKLESLIEQVEAEVEAERARVSAPARDLAN